MRWILILLVCLAGCCTTDISVQADLSPDIYGNPKLKSMQIVCKTSYAGITR